MLGIQSYLALESKTDWQNQIFVSLKYLHNYPDSWLGIKDARKRL